MSNKEGFKKLPDSNRILKDYYCQQLYRLLITSYDLQKLKEYGFSPKRLVINDSMPNRNACQFVKISKITFTKRFDDTYCFNESKKNAGIFNGIITSQCSEIVQYTDKNETAVCNLASIGLPSFVNHQTKEFDYEKLHEVTKVITNNLNKVIDINFYPTEESKVSNFKHRPIGIGVQGLADTFFLMDIPFDSDEAKEVNQYIFETIYHAALEKSNELAIKTKMPYSSFDGSPASKGVLQFDMWDVPVTNNRYNWTELKRSIITDGLRNSLLVAPMPTASTSQILGFNECFEPITSNLYSRRTLAGEFVVINKYLMKELIELGLWDEKIKNSIIANKGSVQHLDILSQHIRNKYKIVWEIPMKHIIDMSADRGAYICQTQSLNLWMEDPTYNALTSMHFYSWKKGLKTGMYYLRRKPKHHAQQFTIEPEEKESVSEKDSICDMCSA
jgi:ribonucleoside-diphosphate reductase alpha chain